MSTSPRIQVSGIAGKTNNYEGAVRNAGGLPFAGYAPEPDLSCQGLILCGGGDVLPSLYGQENTASSLLDLRRDESEQKLIHTYAQAGKPILGICRGMQILNVAFGGTLIQDLPQEQRPFHGGAKPDRVHPIRALEDSVLHRLYGEVFPVNSYHHQAVDILAPGFRAIAWSEGGVVEAMVHDSLPILALQFHPERMAYGNFRPDAVDAAPLLEHFISLCRD